MTTFYRSTRSGRPGLPSQQFFEDYQKALHELNEADKEVAAPIVDAAGDAINAVVNEVEDLASSAVNEVEDLAADALKDIANAAGNIAKPVLVPLIEIGLIAILTLIVVEKII